MMTTGSETSKMTASTQQDAWTGDVPGLLGLLCDAAKDPKYQRGLDRRVRRLKQLGAPVSGLVGWRPVEGDAERLASVRTNATRLLQKGGVGKEKTTKAVVAIGKALEPTSEPWRCLRSLVSTWLESVGAGCLPAGGGLTPRSKTQAPPAGPTTASAKRGLGAATRNKRRHGPARRSSKDRSRPAARKPKPIHIPSVTEFGKDATELLVFVDESWPGSSEGGDPSIGVFAGLVWAGGEPSWNELPSMANHERDNDLCRAALEKLASIPERAFPFVIPLELPAGTEDYAQTAYDELTRAFLQLLLGWLLPSDGPRATVRVFFERQEHRREGEHLSEFFRGYFGSLRDRDPQRYGRWDIETVKCVGKEYGYIAYGDILARLPNPASSSGAYLSQFFSYHQLPGFLKLSLDLLPRLGRLATLNEGGDVDELLVFSTEFYGTALHRVVMDDLRLKIARSRVFAERLWEALATRLVDKDRDIALLRRLFSVVQDLAGEPTSDAGLRLELLHALVTLQAANHDGAPRRADAAMAAYEALRPRALELDRELVCWIDLNLEVHLCDRMDFDRASTVAARLNDDPLFAALPTVLRACAHSGRGQILSMQGARTEAEREFATALALFAGAPMEETKRRAESDQTSVFRAINAIDGFAAGDESFQENAALELVEAVLGPLDQAAAALAEAGPRDKPYHQHLLLRALLHLDAPVEARKTYLAAQGAWQHGITHPWELIALYRALLLTWEQDDDDLGYAAFVEGVEIARDAAHGATLTLIGAMIATAGWCCYREPGLAQTAEEALQQIETTLPEAQGSIVRLRALLEDPPEDQGDGVAQALGALPFNYH